MKQMTSANGVISAAAYFGQHTRWTEVLLPYLVGRSPSEMKQLTWIFLVLIKDLRQKWVPSSGLDVMST